jgi:hypothetical protein
MRWVKLATFLSIHWARSMTTELGEPGRLKPVAEETIPDTSPVIASISPAR